MARPLDHATVIQQVYFAERAHQDLQLHPDSTMAKARVAHRQARAEARERTNPTPAPQRTYVRLHGENYQLSSQGSGTRLDLKA
jgi:hypothetical protein